MTQNNCLMIRTKDRRRFFTPENNYDTLIEFSKVFNAEVSLVHVEEGEILDIDSLVPAICNASYKPAVKPKYELVEVKIPQKSRKLSDRKNLLETASRIKSYVSETFLSGGVVALHDLQERFKDDNLSISCLCNHVARVRKELNKNGKKVIKVKAGHYTIKK
jgi:hypothetical protein